VEACRVPHPPKFRFQPSAGKVITTIFRDSGGLLFIDYFSPKKTITGQYYAEMLRFNYSEVKEYEKVFFYRTLASLQ